MEQKSKSGRNPISQDQVLREGDCGYATLDICSICLDSRKYLSEQYAHLPKEYVSDFGFFEWVMDISHW